MALAQPTRATSDLIDALAGADRSTYKRACARLVKTLASDEEIVAIAVCDSGGKGVLAITAQRALFTLAAMGANVFQLPISEITLAQVKDDTQLNLHRGTDQKFLAFKELAGDDAQQLAGLLWSFGVAEPEPVPEAEEPSDRLPSRDLDELIDTLDEADRDTHRPLCERLVATLDDDEAVQLLAAGKSGDQRLLALTDKRILFVGTNDTASVVKVNLVPFKAVTFARALGPSRLGLGLNSSNWPSELGFSQMRPRLAEAFAGVLNGAGIASSPAEAGLEAKGPDREALNALSPRTLKLVNPSIGPDEDVFVCLVGAHNQALLVMADRLIIAKAGLMSGNTFGGKVTSFLYREITGIEIHTSMMTAVLVVQTPSYPGTLQGSYWDKGTTSPAEMPNMIPLASKSAIRSWQPVLNKIREASVGGGLVRVDDRPDFGPPIMIGPIDKPVAAEPPSNAQPAAGGIADELKKLADLKAAGILTDDEFALAKAKLLS